MSQLEFVPGKGFQLEADFATHRENCQQCVWFDEKSPATAAHLCVAGAVLFKQSSKPKKVVFAPPKDPHQCTKDELKRLMRYK